MSEDTLHIEFSSKELKKSKKKNEFESIYRKFVPEEETSIDESSITYDGDKASYFAGFFDADSSNTALLMKELETAGANDVLATVLYDSVCEEVFFIRVGDECIQFESKEEIKEYVIEASKEAQKLEFNYGKTANRNTALIRLQINAKSKRKKIYELFSRARNLVSAQQHTTFVEGFNALVKSDTHDIEWCKFKWKNDERWREVASNDLIYGLVEVVEDDDNLYLSFDTEKAGKNSEFELDDYIYFVMFALAGVKKIWIKARLERQHPNELYSYHPGMGDEAFFDLRAISDDNHWPR